MARALRRLWPVLLAAALLGAAAPGRALAAFGCGLAAQPATVAYGEGAGAPSGFLRSTGSLRAVMLFVDFPDAPASEDPAALYGRLVPDAQSWLGAVSYGRAQLTVDPVERWYRMPRPSADYGFAGGAPTFFQQRGYMADAVAAADPDVDFSRYDLVYVVPASGAAIPLSPAFVAPAAAWGVPADGSYVRYGITFGADVRAPGGWGSAIIDHETEHAFGLPDLYDPRGFVGAYWGGLRFVGGWDVMSWLGLRPGLLAWQRWRLGWLGDDQVDCLGAGTVVRTLEPTALAGPGLRALVAPISPTAAYVLEVRERIGVDSRLCDSGLLLSRVDTSAGSGDGPIRVLPAQPDSAWAFPSCGPLWNAPFDLGRGEVASFRDPASGFSFRLLARTRDGGYVVRVTKSGG